MLPIDIALFGTAGKDSRRIKAAVICKTSLERLESGNVLCCCTAQGSFTSSQTVRSIRGNQAL